MTVTKTSSSIPKGAFRQVDVQAIDIPVVGGPRIQRLGIGVAVFDKNIRVRVPQFDGLERLHVLLPDANGNYSSTRTVPLKFTQSEEFLGETRDHHEAYLNAEGIDLNAVKKFGVKIVLETNGDHSFSDIYPEGKNTQPLPTVPSVVDTIDPKVAEEFNQHDRAFLFHDGTAQKNLIGFRWDGRVSEQDLQHQVPGLSEIKSVFVRVPTSNGWKNYSAQESVDGALLVGTDALRQFSLLLGPDQMNLGAARDGVAIGLTALVNNREVTLWGQPWGDNLIPHVVKAPGFGG